jgi:hypothetical protein
MANKTDCEIVGAVWHNRIQDVSNSFASELMMKRSMLFVALGAVALMASACAEPEPELLITAHVPLEGSSGDEGEVTGCTAPDSIEGVNVIYQSLFINLDDFQEGNAPMQLGIMMENRLIDSSSYEPIGHDQNQRSNQNHIEVQGYELTFTESGFDSLGDGGVVRTEATGLVPTDGSLWVGLDLFYPYERGPWNDAYASAGGGGGAIVPTFAELQVLGETVGGANVKSNILTVPIQVCKGCSRPSTPICVAPE